ncbi:hypothetical protein ENUP19_0079G0006 [Entamoeba nuttalli]|uniref:Exosome component 10, putative n=2 Tax=Entamoeba nuttalli TaxID=412467 RepID=K2G6C7_ENTNP|nr:exosome component 10, putative [Entamoeba nuttalli P19]EKE37956.1 exosome component 10, putative [Entamoeba nuttalli P19]|eukprot:XP_008859704.1 exosome component 10, putative [Entamoeba nuttalli P19]
MKKQSEIVDSFCESIKKYAVETARSTKSFATGNRYIEMMSYKEFSQSVDIALNEINQTLKMFNDIHPKLHSKLTNNEKERPNDIDVVTHVVDFLLEAVEIEETLELTKNQFDDKPLVINKPQLNFTDKPDNFSVEYKPKCIKKYHSKYPVDAQPHPYINEIHELKQMSWQLEKCTPQPPLSFEKTPLIYVNTLELLQEMIISLNHVNQFAVDVEHHSEHSYYGFVCLLQISTRSSDYIIDTITLRDSITLLNDPFTNPNIEKVFHGCDFDMIWLSYNFGLYVVNCIDSGQCARALKLQHFSLKYLLQKYCNVDADKKYQLADWRLRPLTKEMIEYARGDTHYLLYIIDQLRNECIDAGVLEEVLNKSNELCLRLFRPTVCSDDVIERVARRSWIKKTQFDTFKKLYLLRDKIARIEDESPESIINMTMLSNIVNELPTDLEKLRLCCLPKVPYFVEMHASEFILLTKQEHQIKLNQLQQIQTNETILSDTVKFVQSTLGKNYKQTVIRTDKHFEDII